MRRTLIAFAALVAGTTAFGGSWLTVPFSDTCCLQSLVLYWRCCIESGHGVCLPSASSMIFRLQRCCHLELDSPYTDRIFSKFCENNGPPFRMYSNEVDGVGGWLVVVVVK